MTRPRPAGSRSTRLLGAAAGALILVAAAGCTSLEGTGDKGYVTGDGQVTQIDPADRGEPIELAGDDLDGEAMTLDDLRGEPVVVNVWGSWCGPCAAEMPDLVSAAERTDRMAEYVGIDIRDSTAAAQAFVRTFDVPYPSFASPDGRALLAFSGTLAANSVPSTLVLDAEGRVAASILGPLPSEQTLVTLVEDVAAESEAPASSGGDRG